VAIVPWDKAVPFARKMLGPWICGYCSSTKLGDSTRVFKTVSDYLITLYDNEELSSEATIRKFQVVQTEGNRQVARLVDPYRLAILAVRYRVRSQR
jgi:hypothetical protein